MDSRTDWPDSRLDRLEARINGIPERVATLTAEMKEVREDVAAIRLDIAAIRVTGEQVVEKREGNKTLRVAALITASGAILASLVSSIALLVTQL